MNFSSLVDTTTIAKKYTSFNDPKKIVSMTLLNNPQILLCAALRTKNQLNVILSDVLDIINIIQSFKDSFSVTPKNINDVESLNGIQLALNNSILNSSIQERIDSFLQNNFSHIHSAGDFIMNKNEAIQDLGLYLGAIKILNDKISTLVTGIINAPNNIVSMDFAKNIKDDINDISNQTIGAIKQEINQTSSISIASELLGLKAAQKMINKKVNLFDPLFSSKDVTDVLCKTVDTSAIAYTSIFPNTISDGWLDLIVDGGPLQSFRFPAQPTTFFGTPMLLSNTLINIINVPANTRLFLHFTMNPGVPGPHQYPDCPPDIIPIDLLPGPQPIATIINTISIALFTTDTTSTLRTFGLAEEFAFVGSKILFIYGNTDVAKIEIIPNIPGKYVAGIYQANTDISAHTILGFDKYQTSFFSSQPTIESIIKFLTIAYTGITVSNVNEKIEIKTNTSSLTSSLQFGNTMRSGLGLPSTIVKPVPQFIEILKGISPFSIDAKPNFEIRVNELPFKITTIQDNLLSVEGLTLLPLSHFQIFTDIQILIPKLSNRLAAINTNFNLTKLNRLAIPLFSVSYSMYQVEDFYKMLEEYRQYIFNIQTVLSEYPLTKSNSPAERLYATLISFLESKGLDSMLTNILNGNYKEMFSVSSIAENVLNNIEAIGNATAIEVNNAIEE